MQYFPFFFLGIICLLLEQLIGQENENIVTSSPLLHQWPESSTFLSSVRRGLWLALWAHKQVDASLILPIPRGLNFESPWWPTVRTRSTTSLRRPTDARWRRRRRAVPWGQPRRKAGERGHAWRRAGWALRPYGWGNKRYACQLCKFFTLPIWKKKYPSLVISRKSSACEQHSKSSGHAVQWTVVLWPRLAQIIFTLYFTDLNCRH